jgi:outer membrane protein TolC
MSARFFRLLAVSGLTAATAAGQTGAGVRHLNLKEAVRLAIAQNRALKIARLKVVENEQKKAGERAQYFPTLTNQSNIVHFSPLPEFVSVPAGALGAVAGELIPAQSVNLTQGKNTQYSSGTMLCQPDRCRRSGCVPR